LLNAKIEAMDELQKSISGEISTEQKDIAFYSHDASLFEILPKAVVFPKNTADIQKLVAYASKNKGASLTMRSGGTGMDGGALSESLVVDVSRHLTKISSVKPYSEEHTPRIKGIIKTQPGAFYRDFEKETLSKNLLMPTYPASREICTVGGMVANNAGGELTLQFGKTEDYIKSLKAVFSDGNEYEVKPLTLPELQEKISEGGFEGALYQKLYELISANYALLQEAKPKVSKNSAGYYLWNILDTEKGLFDLTKLLVGSQGTLCIFTEIEFKLVEPLQNSQMMIIFLDDLTQLGELTLEVLKHAPTTFESYDDKTLRLALRFFWSFIQKLGMRNIFTMIKNGIPEGWSILTKGFPKLVLQITFDGDTPEKLRDKAIALEKALKKFNSRYSEILKEKSEAEEYWLVRRESFNLLRNKVKGMKTASFIDDIIVNPEVLPEFLPQLNALLQEYEKYMLYSVAGHLGNGNFHIIPLMDFTQKEVRDIIPEITKKVYDLVITSGGSITGEHNDGIIRTPFLEQQYGKEVTQLFKETKELFDPNNIFNPGKKVGGTLDYAISKIKTHN
jgi:FAD/FMN-containing dehydrogenase